MPTLSVVIPATTERATIRRILNAVRDCGVASLEIVIIDDCSTDRTREILRNEMTSLIAKIIYH